MRSWLLLILVSAIAISGFAGEADLEATHRELTEMNRLEQEAFAAGRCEELLDLLAEDISFYANGRPMTKEAVGAFCERIPRPLPGSGEQETRVRAVSPDAGYVIKTMTFPGTSRVEVVTKIWSRGVDGWKLEHFHSTVTDLQASPSQ